jgi:indolepyruvate ferredoxin oxidoreductase alpha subunit
MGDFKRDPERYNVLPIRVVELHQRLQAAGRSVQTEFEESPLNHLARAGPRGVIAAGHAGQKLANLLARSGDPPLSVLNLGTLYPLPEEQIKRFLEPRDAVLVVEETAPYLEIQLQALAQRAGLTLPIYGRRSSHLPGSGELFAPQIGAALASLLPEWPWPAPEETTRVMPSRQPLCDDCPYIPTFEALLDAIERNGGRDRFIITGETGCMVRGQLPPWEMLDLKYGLGSSIGLAAGLARSGVEQRIVALAGDSALLHSGLMELMDAAQAGARLTVIVLANETAALSGGQPHPGTAHSAQGQPRRPVDLVALTVAAGAEAVYLVDPEDRTRLETALEAALTHEGLAVIIARRECPRLQS